MASRSPAPAPAPSPEGKAASAPIGSRYRESAARTLQSIAATTTRAGDLVDPVGVWAPMARAWAAWWTHPREFADLAARYANDWVALQLHCAGRLAGARDSDFVPAHPDDTRFSDPVWSKEAPWDLLKQWYIFQTRHTQDALFSSPGLPDRDRHRAAFWEREWSNALSPTNFLLTNPVAQRKALETNGESLAKGFQVFLDDMKAGTVRMTRPEDFEVGRNLAVTPGAIVFRNALFELIHYAPTAKKVHRTPLLFVPPWINKFYILDLNPAKSMVRYLLGKGFDVYMVSWKNPGADMADTTFDDYLERGVHEAMRVAREISGAPDVHPVGYCIGGTLVAAYMAWLNARNPKVKDVPVSAWTLFTTLVDFRHPGEIEAFLDEETVRWLSDRMRSRGFLDGADMASTFRLMRSNSLIWAYVVKGWLCGEQPAPFDVLYWNMDTTRMPYRMHDYYLREMYLKNSLVKPGAIELAGTKIDLGRIRQPLYAVSAEDDHIAPWRETFKINHQFHGDKRYVLSSAGHILGIINPPTNPPKRHYRVDASHRTQKGEAWREQAELRQGSWWEDWIAWLAPRCGPKGPPPVVTTRSHPRLADAPGKYVRES